MAKRVGKVAFSCAVLYALCAATYEGFHRQPAKENYILMADRLQAMAEKSEQSPAAQGSEKGVIWDVGNGTHMLDVLRLLPLSDKPKVLILGSSQMLTCWRRDHDDIVNALAARVSHQAVEVDLTADRADSILVRLSRSPIQVHNLSVGASTPGERSELATRAMGLTHYQSIILPFTLWDFREISLDQVRPYAANLPPAAVIQQSIHTPGILDRWMDPSQINKNVKAKCRNVLAEEFPFFHRRSAIQKWAEDLVGGACGFGTSGLDCIRPATAEAHDQAQHKPTQYDWPTPQGRQKTLAKAEWLIEHCHHLATENGAKTLVVLMPFRHDAHNPPYLPAGFYNEFRQRVLNYCQSQKILCLDASELLDGTHFRAYEFGTDAGSWDVVHFDGSGHRLLAEKIADALGIR